MHYCRRLLRLGLISTVFFTLMSCGGGSDEKPATKIPVVVPPIVHATITGSPLVSVNENTEYSFQTQTSNFDQASLTFSIENIPSWASFNSVTGVLRGVPSYTDSGQYSNIVITAFDGTNQATLAAFAINVINVFELSGTVVDGYIRGALVYIDENNNTQFDEDEISAITNSDGLYVLYCPPEKLASLALSPIRAYLGEGAQDMSRPELNFSEVPVTLSLAPINLVMDGEQITNHAVISPFTNEVVEKTKEKINQLNSGEITKEVFQREVDNVQQAIVQQIMLDNNIDLDVINKTEDELKDIVFSDFLKVEEELPELVEEGQRKVDLVVMSSDVRDFDGDNIANNVDDDDDGDGVNDIDDAFRLNAAETIDTDLDGVGNNSDFYADNANCSDENQGNGETCYKSLLNNVEIFTQITTNNDDIFYYFTSDKNLYTYDKANDSFLNVQEVENVNKIVYSLAHQRLYLGFNDGSVKYLNDSYGLNDFTVTATSISGLADVGQFLLVQNDDGAWESHHIFNVDGDLVDSKEWNHYSRMYAWNETQSKVYFFRDGQSPNDLHYEVIDQSSGDIIEQGESPYHGRYNIVPPIVVSNDDEIVLLGSGDLYNASDLTSIGSISNAFDFASWLPDGSLVTFDTNENSTTIIRRNSELSIVEEFSIPNSVIAVFPDGEGLNAVVKSTTGVSFYSYELNDDRDGDGVDNTTDKFPMDPAAALDGDGDGYPDSWNDGQSASNSTSSLILDAYPLDSACWLSEHGVDNQCDYSITMPVFTPDKVVSDSDGNTYLLSSENNKVYVWSIEEERFVNPISIGRSTILNGTSPTQMIISNSHNRLYFGYSSGQITFVDLDTLSQESNFASVPQSIGGLVSVGNYILAQDSSGAWNTHYIFDQQGELTDSADWNRYSRTYGWNESNNRVYFLRDGTSPNDLHYEEINQTLGTIESSGESPYHSSRGITHPVRVSSDGSKVILGSGNIYDAETLMLLGEGLNTNLTFADIAPVPDAIVTLQRITTNDVVSSVIKFWHEDTYQLLNSINYDGIPVSLTYTDNELIITTMSLSGLALRKIPVGDQDEDNMPDWWEYIHSLDSSIASDAVTDGDEDGLTNLQEYQQLTDPNSSDTDGDGINDGDEVNTYSTSPLLEDSDADGLSDGAEINEHLTDPLLIDTDGDTLSDAIEVNEYLSNPLLSDTDGDGIPDSFEVENNLDILLNDALLDVDEDGLSNFEEFTINTNPNKSDTDNDGLSDGDEVNTYLTQPLERDSDSDLIADGWEVLYSLNPLQASDANDDEDSDTYSNKVEYFLGSDPTDGTSVPESDFWGNYQANKGHTGFLPIAIDPDELRLRWSVNLSGNRNNLIISPSVSSSGKVFVAHSQYEEINNSTSFSLSAINASNGSTLWSTTRNTQISALSVDSQKVFFRTDNSINPGTIEALDLNTGQSQYSEPSSIRYNSTNVSATIDNEAAYVINDNSGSLVKVDIDTGIEQWSTNLNYCYNNLRDTTPSIGSDIYYYNNGKLLSYDKATGVVISEVDIDVDNSNRECATPILGGQEDIFIMGQSALYAIDTLTSTVKWQYSGSFNSSPRDMVPSIGVGRVYILDAGELNVLDQFTGDQVWSWKPSNNNNLQGKIVLSLNLAFVQDNINTYAIDIETQQQVWSYPIQGELSLSKEGAIYITSSDGTLTAIDFAIDTDEDGIDDWWEDLYGLDKNDNADAALDLDSDLLTNLEEFTYSTNPSISDTDNDELSDYDEINTHLSNPNSVDTDLDGMADGWEVTHSLDLLNSGDALLDADNDSITNINEYRENTDPNDATSLPEVITDFVESFESGTIPDVWVVDDSMDSGWGVSSVNDASDGDFYIFSSGRSGIEFNAFFMGNNLTFDIQSQCSYNSTVQVYLDGISIEQKNMPSDAWQSIDVSLPKGRHTIKIITDSCGAYLDNMQFSELPHLFVSDIEMVGTDASNLVFYSTSGDVAQSVKFPNNDNGSYRNVSIMTNGNIVVPLKSSANRFGIFNPKQHLWEVKSFDDGQNVVNNSKVIATYDNYIYALDNTGDYTGNNAYSGLQIIRYNVLLGATDFYAINHLYLDFYVNGSSLYALRSNAIDVYDRDSMELTNSFTTSNEAMALAVDSLENLYTVTYSGLINKYSSSGIEVGEVQLPINGIRDIKVRDRDVIHIVNLHSQQVVTSPELSTFVTSSLTYNTNNIAFLPFVDNDEDGLPIWWEYKYELSDEDDTDAALDPDGEGLSNLEEYLHKTSPNDRDSDDDLLDDFVEVNTHLTSPILSDTDGDNLSDNDELNTYFTNPLNKDSDEDGFNDDDEINLYGTEPNDVDSKPDAIDNLMINFNDQIISSAWVESDDSEAAWIIDDLGGADYAMRSGDINDNQQSMIEITNVFANGTFGFSAKVESESCCDHLSVYVDDVQVVQTSNQLWDNYSFELASGEHTIKFVYSKDGSVTSGEDTVWVDNITFE